MNELIVRLVDFTFIAFNRKNYGSEEERIWY